MEFVKNSSNRVLADRMIYLWQLITHSDEKVDEVDDLNEEEQTQKKKRERVLLVQLPKRG